MELVKDRQLQPGQRVRVYINLNRSKSSESVFSIADHKSGLVVAYAQQVTLAHVLFKIRESGRLRALKTGQRNVHAWAIWTFLDADITRNEMLSIPLYYNPFKVANFVVEGTKTVIEEVSIAHFKDRRVWISDAHSERESKSFDQLVLI